MLYTKIQPPSFLGSGEEDFKCVLITKYGNGGYIFQRCGTI